MTPLCQLIDKDDETDDDFMNNLDVLSTIEVQVDDTLMNENDAMYCDYDERMTYQ